MFKLLPIAALGLIGAILCSPQTAQQRDAQFRAKFAKESDPLHKAQLMPQFGSLEFQDAEDALDQDNLAKAAETVKEYRDQVRSCARELDAKVTDPEKHPAGFKQLQISLRQALRRLDDIIHALPADDQKPFLEVRKDLDDLDRHLVRELFPRQPDAAPPPVNPKS